MNSEFDRPRCPKCGRFVANARAFANDERLTSVEGDCREHGTVPLGSSWWVWEFWIDGDAA